MPKHSHKFVEEHDGLVGFGFDRETDEQTLIYYLQKFSDDSHAALILSRMTGPELEELFNHLGRLMSKYLTEEEYHSVFLKDGS
jgi:hypothetical protein